jgi:hypothetical protein
MWHPQSTLTALQMAESVPNATLRGKLFRVIQECSAAPEPRPPPPSTAACAAPADVCDVMISYRVPETGDRGDGCVFVLRRALEARGFTVFVSEGGGIRAGDDWPNEIQRRVRECAALVVLCSATYGDAKVSRWTHLELNLAHNLGKLLLPVWHSGPFPPPGVEIQLTTKQRVPIAASASGGGYTAEGISHEAVAAELAEALLRKGVPKRRKEAAPAGAAA